MREFLKLPLLLLGILCLASSTTVAQSNDCGAAKEQAEEFKLAGDEFIDSAAELAIVHYQKALSSLEDCPPSPEKMRYSELVGYCLANIGLIDSAKYYYDLSSDINIALGDYSALLRTRYRYIDYCFIEYGNYSEALELALVMKHYADSLGGPDEIFLANRTLTQIYFFLPEYQEDYLKLAQENKAISYSQKDTTRIQNSLFALASAYSYNDLREKSMETYKQLIALEMEMDYKGVYAPINNLGGQFRQLGMTDSAIFYYKLGEEWAQRHNQPVGIAASRLYRGQIAFQQGEYSKAETLFKQSLEIFVENNIRRRQSVCAQGLYLVNRELGDMDEALYYLEFQHVMEDSLNQDQIALEGRLVKQQFNHQVEQVSDSLSYSYQHELKEAEIEQQRQRSVYLYIGLGLSLLFGIFIFNRFRITRKQKLVIEDQKVEIDEQHQQLQETHKEITDSITYAKRIQSAILPSDRLINELLGESFVFYLPKDVVAGDFYWLETIDNNGGFLLAAADCTGHGVPGAMVSVVCHNSLNRAVREFSLRNPAEILNKVRELVIETFEKSDKEIKDGMDIALLSYANGKLEFAGANNPLWILRNSEIIEVKADKQPIGKFSYEEPFKNHSIEVQKNDIIYIFTDGMVDQFGGDKGKKLKSANFKQLLISLNDVQLSEQGTHLHKAFDDWRGSLEQVDDICVIGMKI